MFKIGRDLINQEEINYLEKNYEEESKNYPKRKFDAEGVIEFLFEEKGFSKNDILKFYNCYEWFFKILLKELIDKFPEKFI